MKNTIITLIALFFANGVFSQKYIVQVKPFSQKKWGYANLEGELIIGAKYSKC